MNGEDAPEAMLRYGIEWTSQAQDTADKGDKS
jgi:hypothetical protein